MVVNKRMLPQQFKHLQIIWNKILVLLYFTLDEKKNGGAAVLIVKSDGPSVKHIL